MSSTTNVFLFLSFVLLWSLGWIGSKYGVDLTGSFKFLVWRYLIVVLILAVLLVLKESWKPLTRREWIQHLCIGVLLHGIYLGASLSAM